MPTIKTRKDHICGYCNKIIKKGSKCHFEEGKEPRLDENDDQIGIKYWKVWLCIDNNDCFYEKEDISG